MSGSNGKRLLKRLNPFAVVAILSAATVAATVLCLLHVAIRATFDGRSPVVIGDPRTFHKYYDEQHGNATSQEVTPQYVLWGTEEGGVEAYDRETGLWREFTRQNTGGRLPADELRQILLAPDGRKLYYATSLGGLARSSDNLKTWETLYPTEGCPVSLDEIRVVTMLGQRWLVLGTEFSGLCLYSTLTRKWQQISRRESDGDQNGLSASRVTDLLYLEATGRKGHLLLVGTTGGVDEFRVDVDDVGSPLTFSRTELGERHIVCFDPTGRASKGQRVLCRTAAGGVAWRTPDGEWQQIIGDRGFVATGRPHVEMARLDRQHNLLVVGTAAHGWDVYDMVRREWRNPANRIGTRIYDVLPFAGQWWIATGHGVQIYDPKGKDDEDIQEVSTPPSAPPFVASSAVVQLAANGDTVFVRTAKGGLIAYRPPDKWHTLIPHEPCPNVSNGTMIGVAVHRDELWMAYANGQVLVYDQQEHRLRHEEAGLSDDKDSPRRLACFAKSRRRLWCVVANTNGGPGELSYRSGSTWRRFTRAGPSITRISPLGDGLLAQTAKGTLWYVPDSLKDPQEFFTGGPNQNLVDVPIAAVVSEDGETIYLTARGPQSDPRLYAYQPRARRWSDREIPFDSGVRELHERAGVLFAVTDTGGLWQCDADASGRWRELASDQGLRAEDRKDPTIVSAAETEDGPIYVAFRSGNVYEHRPENGKWSPKVPAASNHADVLLDKGFLWRAYQDGMLAVSEQDGGQSTTLFASRLGSQPGRVVLAADDATRHLWIVTAGGRVGAYNLVTHRWDLAAQLAGEAPFSIQRWAIAQHAADRDFFWLATNHGVAVFSASESDAYLSCQFPGMELRAAATGNGHVYCVVSDRVGDAGGAQHLHRIAAADGRSALCCRLPPIGPVNAINLIGGEVWARTGDNGVRAYSVASGQWHVVAESWGPFRRPTRQSAKTIYRGWIPLVPLTLAMLTLIGSAICFTISLIGRHRQRLLVWERRRTPHGRRSPLKARLQDLRRKERRFRRVAPRLLGATCLLGFIYLVSPLCAVNLVLWPSTSDAGSRGQAGPLSWRTDQYGAQLTIQGRDQGKPVFDEQGRFLFDVVEGLDIDRKATLLHTPVGVWRCVPSTEEPPESFAALKASFHDPSTGSYRPGRLLFEREEWSWHYTAGTDHTVSVRRRDGLGRSRSFVDGQWEDLVAQGMAVPDDSELPMLVYTAAGVYELEVATETDKEIRRSSRTTTQRRSEYVETRSFSSRLAKEPHDWPNRPKSKGTIHSENCLRWLLGDHGLVVELNGQKVPMLPCGQQYCLATENVRDFVVTDHGSSPTFWVNSAHQHEKYTLDQAGVLSIRESVAEEVSSVFAGRRKPAPVRYAGTLWEHTGDGYVGSYEKPEAGEGAILGGRVRHDVIRDMSVEAGRLRLVTDTGFVVYRYDGQLAEVRRSFVDPNDIEPLREPYRYAFNGRQWNDPSEGTLSSVLSIVRSDGHPSPAAFVKIVDGSYKFDFDTVSQLRLDERRAQFETHNGTLEFTLGRTNSHFSSWQQGTVEPRPDSVAVFDSSRETWRLEAPRPIGDTGTSSMIPGILNKQATSNGSICEVQLVQQSAKFPWDHVDSIGIVGDEMRVWTREGIARVGGKGLDPLPQVGTALRKGRQHNREFDNLDDSWGKIVAVHEDEDYTWVACENRLVRLDNDRAN